MAINVQNVTLKISAGEPRQILGDPTPQVAFSGRSNVGKSSLINSLLGRKSLARVSSAPGKTITINFYDVDKKLYLVDLPGYGYAKVGKDSRDKLEKMIKGYILNRNLLVNLFVLIDCRLEPQKIDLEFFDFLGVNGVPFSIVFTKADKLGKNELAKNLEAYKEKLYEQWEELPPIFVTSSENQMGREDLLDYIESINESLQE